MTGRIQRRLVITVALVFAWSPTTLPLAREPEQQPTLSPRPDDVQSLKIPSVSRAELELIGRARTSINTASRWNHRDDFACPPRASSLSLLVMVEPISPSNRNQTRDVQETKHEIGSNFAEAELTQAAFQVVELRDPFAYRDKSCGKVSSFNPEVPDWWMLVARPRN